MLSVEIFYILVVDSSRHRGEKRMIARSIKTRGSQEISPSESLILLIENFESNEFNELYLIRSHAY